MVDWKELRGLNLKEVSLKTQIEIRFLEALVERDFLTLSRFNVYGFIKILSREYGLDFGDFMQEYEEYLNENNLGVQTKSRSSIVIHELDSYHPRRRFFLLFVVSMVIFVGIIGFRVYFFDTFKGFFQSEENNVSAASMVSIVNEAQTNLKDLGNDVLVIGDEKNENSNVEENAGAKDLGNGFLNEDNETLAEINASQNDTNTEVLSIQVEKNATQDTEAVEGSSSLLERQVMFRANMKVWVGFIDLGTYKKTTFIKQGDFNVSLAKDKLILTGAAALDVIDEEGKEERFPAGAPKRFLVKDGKVKSITLVEFMKLNKGKEW